MKKVFFSAACLAIALGAATSADALDNVRLKGSDTLFDVTNAVIAACPGAAGLTYDGTGSSAGEAAMKTGAQTIAPMSRFLTSGNTCTVTAPSGTPASAEGIVLGLDGLSVVGATATSGAAACNGASADCNRATEPNAGLAYSTTVTYAGGSYTFNGWRDVLRVLYAGMDHNAGSTIANRNCNSPVRQAIANNWGNLFQGTCSGGSCTQLHRAFRRDDLSGTTDTFVAVLGLPSINATSNVSPFCNTALSSETLPTGVTRLSADFQDNDPIRRACAGTNNGSTPPDAATEQVCGRKGDLGLVVPIHPVDFLAPADAFPTTPCTTRTIFGRAPRAITGAVRCPNGDVPVFIDQCLVPVDASGSAACLAGKNTKPAFVFDNTPVDGMAPSAVDGRVYNLHLRQANGQYQNDRRTPPRGIAGAFHRIHTSRTLRAPFTSGACLNRDATSQIGCLVQASPCSIGFAGKEATTETGVAALKVNALEPTVQCIRDFAYPLTRKLYFNSLLGFEGVTGQELALARCMADASVIDPILTANGFVTLGRAPYCEDFNQAICGQSNTNACAGNPSGVPGATGSTACGNGTTEFGEQCDDGNVASGDGCSSTCLSE